LTVRRNITMEAQLSKGRLTCPRAEALGAAPVFGSC
jgi:hypothetical protein